MSLKYGWFGSELIKSCLDLEQLALYRRYSNDYCFYLDIPGLDVPALGTIMGDGGEEFGINIFFGENALKYFMALLDGADHRTITRKAHIMGYSMSPIGQHIPDSKNWIKSTKYKYSSGDTLPEFLVIEPGKFARLPNDHETRILLYAIRGILKSCKEKTFAPRNTTPENGIFTLVISGEADQPTVKAEFRYTEGVSETQPVSPAIGPVNMFEFSGLPKRKEDWIALVIDMPIAIGDDDSMGTAMFIVERGKGPIACNTVAGPDGPNTWLALREIITGKVNAKNLPIEAPQPGLPATITFNDGDLYEIAKQNLNQVGVECFYTPDSQEINGIVDSFHNTMEKIFKGEIPTDLRQELEGFLEDDDGEEEKLLGDIIGVGIPAKNNLKKWKTADGFLKEMLQDIMLDENVYTSSRAQKKYFGVGDFDYLMETYENLAIEQAYLGWLAFSYRPTRKSHTIAGKWLKDKKLHPAMRQMLESLLQNPPSIYSIEKVDTKKGLLTLEDILLGGKVVVTDFAMSGCVDPRFFITAHVYQAGDFNFILPAGPVFNHMQVSHALDFLNLCNLRYEREHMLQHAYAFGWLWSIYDEIKKHSKQKLVNTDGEPLALHTASFEIGNEQALIAALKKRKDVFWDDDEGCYRWVKKGSKNSGMDSVLAGRLTVISDELLLDTNSEQRYRRGRKWLEQIKGIKYKNVSVRGPEEEIPLDSKLARMSEPDISQIPEDVKLQLKAQMENYYTQWLDTEIPALDNMTPREAASMKDMRPRLKALIRTFNPPSNLGGLAMPSPVEMLMRELGLD